MKKILLTTILLFFYVFLFGTHNCCGYIKVKSFGDLTVEATIVTYTKASAIPADRDSLIIDWGDGEDEWIARDTSYLIADNIQFNSYTWTHTYSTGDWYTISMTDPNRTGGILNVFLSDLIPFHIQTTVLVTNFYNETPNFLNSPILIGTQFDPLSVNLNMFDVDGDSLTYELQVPYQGIDSPIPNYSLPSDIGPTSSFDLNLLTGTLTWDAPQIGGRYLIAIKISEYRNGNLIGETIFDCELTILSTSNLMEIPEKTLLKTFPNPISNEPLNFILPDQLVNKKISLYIFSIDGKLQFQNEITPSIATQSIEVQALNKGNYLLKVSGGGKFYYNVFVKK